MRVASHLSASTGAASDPEERERRRHVDEIFLVCVVLITVVAIVFLLQFLAGVLVPLTFAIFLAFLMEPILKCIVLLPQSSRCCRCCRSRHVRRSVNVARRAAQPSLPLEGLLTRVRADSAVDSLAFVETRGLLWLQSAWDFVGVALCCVLLVGFVGGPIIFSCQAASAFDWKNFADKDKVDDIKEALGAIGIDNKTWSFGKVVTDHESQVVSVASTTIDVVSSVVLTVLLFVFSLVATLPGIHQGRPTPPVRKLMQQYLLWKSAATLVITGAVMVTLLIMKVPLVPVCGVLTFTLNFIPNVGSFLAILVPLPLVYLKKGSTGTDVLLAGLIPFLIHNFFGCLLEPQLMAVGLELHPLTVVVALTFWGCVWGIPGAVLSVPITCAVKLALDDIERPLWWVRELRSRLDDPLGWGSGHEEVVEAADVSGSQLATPL